jgi:hypothetical protein
VGTPEGHAEGDSREELERRLRRLLADQAPIAAAATGDPEACEKLCSLSTSICGVQEKLCNIAAEHGGDDSYQQLCREAKLECRHAQESCISCVERHRVEPAPTE